MSVFSSAQTKEEQELIKKANALFEKEKYVEAEPLFSHLLSTNPASPEYNYKYGTCLLYADGDKTNGLKHLLYASTQKGVPVECYYYLAKAYHINYQFAEAIKYYQKFKSLVPSKETERFQVDRQIEMCNNGKKLLRNITEMVVIDKREIDQDKFFRLYSMDNIGGQIIVVEDLQTSLDKKREHRVVVHNPKNSDVVFYSSYGQDGKNGLDIYKVKRLPNGEWAQPQIVRGFVNTPYDEDFPYMHPDGKTLYFCSKGHNSMGGYDVFRSFYDDETDQFSTPENVDFAISSPDDDIFYIVDSLDKQAWFASSRESENGKIHVYNVRVGKIPVLISVIKGKFVSEVSPNNLGASIRVEDMATNEVVGVYNTKTADGSYLITLPKSGKYKFTVVSDNSKIAHVGVVDVPYQKELRVLKQELDLVMSEGQEQLKIRNLFDQNVEDSDALIAQILKDKGALNPNTNDFNLDSLDKVFEEQRRDSVLDAALPLNLTDEDLIKMVKDDAAELAKEAQELKEKSEAAYVVADKKNDEAKEKARQAEQLLNSLNNITDENEKRQIIANANELNNESKSLLKESAAAFEVAKNLDEQYKKKTEEANLASKYADGIEKAINSKNREEAIAQLKKQQEYIKGVMKPDVDKTDELTELKRKAGQKKDEANKQFNELNTLRDEAADLTTDLNNLNAQLEKTTNKNKRSELEKEIELKTSDLNDINEAIKSTLRKQEAIQREADELASQVAILEEIQNGNISGTLSETEKTALANEINSGEISNSISNNDKILNENSEKARDDRYNNQYIQDNPEYQELLKQEKNISAANENDRLRKQNELNERWINTVDRDIASLEKQNKSEKDPEKKKARQEQINTLKSIRDDKKKQIDRNNERIASGNNSNTADKTDVIKNVDPGYETNLTEIKNSNVPEGEKLKQENELNRDLIADVNNKIKEKENAIGNASGTERDKLLEEKRQLEELKQDKENEIARNDEKITQLNTAETNTSENVADISKVDNKYEDKLNTIKSSDKSEEEKLKEENKLNEQLIANIDKQEKLLDKKIDKASGEEKEKLLREKAELDNLKKRKQDEIAQNSNRINNTNVASSTVDENQLVPDYNSRENEIRSSNKPSEEKLKEENALIDQLVDKIDDRIRQNEEELSSATGSQKEKLENENQSLNQLKNEKLNEKRANENQLNNTNTVSNNTPENNNFTNPASNVNKAKLAYESELASVENSSLSSEEKAAERIKINEERLNQIKEEKRIANQQGNTEVADELLVEEMRIEASVKQDKSVVNGEVPQLTESQKKQEQETASVIDPAYENRLNSIENSSKSDLRKEKEKSDLNRELITKVDYQIGQLQQDIAAGNVTDINTAEKELQELKELKQNKENEIAVADHKLAEAGINRADENGRSVSGYAFMSEFETEAARDLMKKIQPKIEEIRRLEDALTELKLRRAEAQTEKEKDEITREILKLEDQLTKTELEIAQDVEEANKIERKELEKRLADVRGKVIAMNVAEDDPNLIAAKKMEDKAAKKFQDATDFRNAAKKEKDKQKKNLLLMKANIAEQLGNKYTQAATKNYDKIVNPGTSGVSGENVARVDDVDPQYKNRIEAAENASTGEEKLRQKTAANNDLIAKIDNQINELRRTNPNDPATKEKIAQLENLKRQKQNENTRNEQLLANSAVNNTNTENVATATDPQIIAANNSLINSVGEKQNMIAENTATKGDSRVQQAKDKQKQAEQLIDEAIQLKKQAYTTNDPSEKKRLIDQAAEKERKANALLKESDALYDAVLRENNIAVSNPNNSGTKFAAENNSLNVAIENKHNSLTGSSSVENDPRIAEANNYQRKANQLIEEANQLRIQADNTNDPVQKKGLLDKALEKEREANELLKSADRIYDEVIAGNGTVADISRPDPEIISDNDKQKDKFLKANNVVLKDNILKKDPQIKMANELNKQADKKWNEAVALRKRASTETNEEKKQEYLEASVAKEKESNELYIQSNILMDEKLNEKSISINGSQNLTVADPVISRENKSEKSKYDNYYAAVSDHSELKNNPEISQAVDDHNKANQLIEEAADLRVQAKNENDPKRKAELYLEADKKEKQANQLYKSANRAIEQVFNAQSLSLNETHVPENVEDRASAKKLNEASELKSKADYLLTRAQQLEDSAATVKKKYRQPILDDASNKRTEASRITEEANALTQEGNQLKSEEDVVLAERERKAQQEVERREKLENVINTAEYASVYERKKAADRYRSNAARADKQLNDERKIAENIRTEIADVKVKSNNESDPERKRQLQNQARELEVKANTLERRQDSLRNEVSQNNRKAEEAERDLKNYLNTLDRQKADDIRFATNDLSDLPQPVKSIAATNISNEISNMRPEDVARKYAAPPVVETDIFVKSDKAVYSTANPIPVDEKLPEGIYFKVQIGAFRNPIPQDNFKEFVPITGERTNSGLTRYTVGYFTQFQNADNAKKEIRGMGYSDAFVVAFKNGKRIPIYEAVAELGGNTLALNNANNTNNGNNNNNTNNTGDNNNSNNTNNTGTSNVNNNTDNVSGFVPDPNAGNYYNDVNAVKAKQVEVIPGLFYTVQVGVYSKPVTADKIYNISPLNTEKIPGSGLIRYTSGMFTDLNEANRRKDEIRQIGVGDAFVTAYMNGKRITLTEAKELVDKYGTQVFAANGGVINNVVNANNNNTNSNNNTTENNIIENNTTTNNHTENNVSENNNTNIENNTNNNTNNTNTTNTSNEPLIVPAKGLKVILGQYQKEVPVREAEVYLSSLSYGIRKAKLPDGSTVYYIDKVADQQKADELVKYFTDRGLKNVRVSTELPNGGGATAINEVQPKFSNDIRFQVYLGQYLGEVPPEATEIFLNNYDLGVKRKTLGDGTIVYYVLDSPDYDEALKMKAHFIAEGLSSVQIVAFRNNAEIPLGEAFISGLSFSVVLDKYLDEKSPDVEDAIRDLPQFNVVESEGADGFKVLSVNKVKTFDQALEIKALFILEGLSTVEIVAFKDGKEVSLSEALRLMYE